MSSKEAFHYKHPMKSPCTVDTVPMDFTTEPVEPDNSVELPMSLPKPHVVTEGGIGKKRKINQSGATEILQQLKNRTTSGKMIDKQMEFATKLAEFEEVRDELEAEKADAGAAYLCKVPNPPAWVNDPQRQPTLPTVEAKLEASNNSDVAMERLAKITKLSDCMKHMNIEAHPHFLRSWFLGGLRAEAEAAGAKVLEAPSLCHRAVVVSRTMPRELVADQKKVQLSSPRSRSPRALYVLTTSEAVPLLRGAGEDGLTPHMAARKQMLKAHVTLVLLDTEKYFKKGKPEEDLETAIVDLLVSLEVDCEVCTSAEELVALILRHTRAVAEEPAKLAKRAVDEEAEFYMRGDNKNCVTVDQQGNGLPRMWQQMLSVLTNCSLEMARALAARYSTPRQLTEVLSTEEGVAQVAELAVPRSAAPGSRPRRLGKEMARRLKIIFTETNGDVIVE